jgi:hypothetical protein
LAIADALAQTILSVEILRLQLLDEMLRQAAILTRAEMRNLPLLCLASFVRHRIRIFVQARHEVVSEDLRSTKRKYCKHI